MKPIISNAKITGTMLGKEDHGIFTCYIYLDYGDSGQGFGGCALDTYNKTRENRVGTAYGLEFIKRILEVVGVENWEDLKGKYVRAEYDYGKVYRIGNVIHDKWFSPNDIKDVQ